MRRSRSAARLALENILLEHGGRIVATNRADAPGALFELQIPVVR